MTKYSKTIKTNKNLISAKEAEASNKIEYIKNHSLSTKEKKMVQIEISKLKSEIRSLEAETQNLIKINNRNKFNIDMIDYISIINSIDKDAIYNYNSSSTVASYNRSFPINVREAICEYYAI